MLGNAKKYFDALAVWKGLGLSEAEVVSTMKKLKKDESLISYIKNGYKTFVKMWRCVRLNLLNEWHGA
ncbi:hypothetical protein GN244_ATG11052 [Phytophthora infestans]|uniref:Uncharacterized protein n=1 Tax=Phytophthora infestans TaxID=4787 RepID=A0A833SQZ9_PHYIN|nr:hypothetical protein GN244_ATG11052 [Phytophthora infestans]